MMHTKKERSGIMALEMNKFEVLLGIKIHNFRDRDLSRVK